MKQKSIKKLIFTFVFVFLFAVILSGCSSSAQTSIDTYDECVKAKGSVILESYPVQCKTKDGRTFVQIK
jgi:hypothetical protein